MELKRLNNKGIHKAVEFLDQIHPGFYDQATISEKRVYFPYNEKAISLITEYAIEHGIHFIYEGLINEHGHLLCSKVGFKILVEQGGLARTVSTLLQAAAGDEQAAEDVLAAGEPGDIDDVGDIKNEQPAPSENVPKQIQPKNELYKSDDQKFDDFVEQLKTELGDIRADVNPDDLKQAFVDAGNALQ